MKYLAWQEIDWGGKVKIIVDSSNLIPWKNKSSFTCSFPDIFVWKMFQFADLSSKAGRDVCINLYNETYIVPGEGCSDFLVSCFGGAWGAWFDLLRSSAMSMVSVLLHSMCFCWDSYKHVTEEVNADFFFSFPFSAFAREKSKWKSRLE